MSNNESTGTSGDANQMSYISEDDKRSQHTVQHTQEHTEHVHPNQIDPESEESGAIPKKRQTKTVTFVADSAETISASPNIDGPDEVKLNLQISGKIPPELAYIHRRSELPKPLPQTVKVNKQKKHRDKALSLDDIPDLPSRAVKEISAVNKNTVLNFNYHEVVLPIGLDRILVDVKYSCLFSPDISKLRKYTYNISNERIGIGYDYVGEIIEVGSLYANDEKFKKGTTVFGVTNPSEKKGALQSCVIINPSDVIIPLSDKEVTELENINISLYSPTNSDFELDDGGSGDAGDVDNLGKFSDIPPLAKFCTFGSQYCRAKQALSVMDKVFSKQGKANVLINGADTILGTMITQIIASSIYQESVRNCNITLVVQEKNMLSIKSLVSRLDHVASRNFSVVAYDMNPNDVVHSGDQIPVHFKKAPFFATEIFDGILKPILASEKIKNSNTQDLKLDLFIDIIGCKKMFQKPIDMLKIDQINFPLMSRLDEGLKPSYIFGKAKGTLLLKIMKPKSYGSSFVSFCNFDLPEPSYCVDKQITFSGTGLDPWALSWTRGLANRLIGSYNYYEMFQLQIKECWVEEGYSLVKKGELCVQIDEIIDWRIDFRKSIERIKSKDGLVLFQVESF